jgi:hypothetical protein
MNVFSRFKFHMFYVISICDLFTNSSSYTYIILRLSHLQLKCVTSVFDNRQRGMLKISQIFRKPCSYHFRVNDWKNKEW